MPDAAENGKMNDLTNARAERAHTGTTMVGLAPSLAPLALPQRLRPAPARDAPLPTMHTMTTAEIDSFVSAQDFGVLALADGNHAYGVPLFYGAQDDVVYFQTRAGKKSHYLYATTEACLTISAPLGRGEWASVQLIGRLERVDAPDAGSDARGALARVPPPLLWAEGDERSNEAEPATTFRLVPARRVGRYSRPARQALRERKQGYDGM